MSGYSINQGLSLGNIPQPLIKKASSCQVVTDKILVYIAKYLPFSELKVLFAATHEHGATNKRQEAFTLLQSLDYLPKLNMFTAERLVRFAKKHSWTGQQLTTLVNYAKKSKTSTATDWIAYTKILEQIDGPEAPYVFLSINVAKEDMNLAFAILNELLIRSEQPDLDTDTHDQICSLIGEFLFHDEEDVRHRAMEVLARGMKERHLDILLKYANKAPQEDHLPLIFYLSEFQGSKVNLKIYKIFVQSQDPHVQLEAITILSERTPESMFEYLSQDIISNQELFSEHDFEWGKYLVITGGKKALPYLELMANSNIPYLQQQALQGVLQLGEGLDIVKKFVQDRSSFLKKTALEALKGFKSLEADTYLCSLCEEGDLDTQREALDVLTFKNPSLAFPYILKAIDRKNNPLHQQDGFYLLARVGGEKAVDKLLECVGKLSDYPLSLLASSLFLLEDISPRLLPAIFKVLKALQQKEQEYFPYIKQILHKLLLFNTDDNKEVFLAAINSEDTTIRMIAMFGLKDERDKHVPKAVLDMVSDPDEMIRLHLAELLRDVDSIGVYQALQTLAQDRKAAVANMAVDSLTYRVKSHFLVGRLKQTLEPLGPKHQAGFEKSYQFLSSLASHPSREIRQMIVKMWGDIGGNLALSHLNKRLKEESNPQVLEEIVACLEKLAES